MAGCGGTRERPDFSVFLLKRSPFVLWPSIGLYNFSGRFLETESGICGPGGEELSVCLQEAAGTAQEGQRQCPGDQDFIRKVVIFLSSREAGSTEE